ncbi:hypothetical protein CSKR_107234 [Clonorchis sinensis]|uniref:G-protein coupled receptors family 1 profile domain-containing protein n=1 Tax=Clonorchis sinensis TaxID=79923 RepID=A0A3R7G6R9_CLOSI|nr:hypothetical protein CSKR_107234 [Clonorchis sinensis]
MICNFMFSTGILIAVVCVPFAISTNSTIAPPPTNLTDVFHRYPTWADLAKNIMPVCLFVDRYVTLVFYVVGFPGNLVSFVVWTSRRVYIGNSAAVYLAAVSLNDIFVLVFALLRDLSRTWSVNVYNPPGACEVKNTLQTAVQYASPLFVLGFTVERWLAIYRPFAIERISSPRRAIYICIGIIVGTIITCSGNAVVFMADNRGECDKRFKQTRAPDVYFASLELVFSFVVPLLVLLFNCLVIRELARIHRADKQLASASARLSTIMPAEESNAAPSTRLGAPFPQSPWPEATKSPRSSRTDQPYTGSGITFPLPESKRRSGHLGSNGSQVFRRRSKARDVNIEQNGRRSGQSSPSFRSTTLMLLIVSFYMIITTLLGGILYVLHHMQKFPNPNLSDEEMQTDPDWITYTRLMTIKAFGDEFALSYYAFGFFIYYCTGQNFRNRVHQLLRRLLNLCGFHCKSLSRLGVSEELEFTSAARQRTQRTRATTIINPTFGDGGAGAGGVVNAAAELLPSNSSAMNGVPNKSGEEHSLPNHTDSLSHTISLVTTTTAMA